MGRLLWAILLLLVPALGACAGPYASLHPENSVSELSTLASTFAQRGNHTTLVPTKGDSGQDIRIALHEIRSGQDRPLLVCIHGAFADHSMWRYLGGDLTPDFDLLLVDLPGCGESDCPDADRSPPETYTVHDIARRTLEALQAYFEQRPPGRRFSVAGHSLGGAVTIRMFADPALRTEFSGLLARADRLVLLAPLDVAVEKVHPLLLEVSRISGVRVWTAFQLGFLRDRVAEGVRSATAKPERALREEADAKVSILTDWSRRRAMQAMLSRAVPYRDGRPDWDRIDAIVATYPNVTLPTLVIWGVRDEVLPVSMGYKLTAELGNAQLVAVPRGMHSLVLEEPRAIGWVVREFMAGRPVGRAIPHAAEPAPAPGYTP